MRSLQRYGVNFAIVVSALLFGAYHFILFQSIFAFFTGLLLAYVCQRFSIKWSMLLHILNNGFSMVCLRLNVPANALYIFYAVALLGSVIIIISRRKFIASEIRRGRPTAMPEVLAIPQVNYPASAVGMPTGAMPAVAVPATSAGSATLPLSATSISLPVSLCPRPFAVAFSSPLMIVMLSIALVAAVVMQVMA